MPQLLRSAAYFPVSDVDKSIAYYETVLGFTTDYRAGSPAQFGIVSRDGLPVMLRRVDDATRISPSEMQGGTWDVFFWVSTLDELFSEFQNAGAEIVYEPVVQPYHTREFALRDCDGHVLGFGETVK